MYTFNDLKDLCEFIADNMKPDILVVEGYNGVGKSRVLEYLQRYFGVQAYRPDYNGWCKKVAQKDRWILSLAFVDIMKNQSINFNHIVLLDRSFISGSVYNGDMNLALSYKPVVEDMKIVHVLVTCPRESYEAMCSTRASSKELRYDDYLVFTERYRNALQVANLPYVEFYNIYDENLGSMHAKTCRGCSHYNISDSSCKHPLVQKSVDPTNKRCGYSQDWEVQDVG